MNSKFIYILLSIIGSGIVFSSNLLPILNSTNIERQSNSVYIIGIMVEFEPEIVDDPRTTGHGTFLKHSNIDSMVNVITSIDNEIGLKNIKIGLGSPPIRNLIVNSLRNYKNIIQYIDEKRSGSGSHIEAAIRIASRLPETNQPVDYSPKDGEIAWIQKQSRRLSKGLITIDKETANRILLGEISIEEAVRKYTERLIKTNQ